MAKVKTDPHTYTHNVVSGLAKGCECFIYRKVPGSNGQVYIRTNDGRAFWEDEIHLKEKEDGNKS